MSDQQHIPGMPSSNDEQVSQSEAMMQPRHPLPGAVLAGERQARGWSVEYVASHLKLAIRQVHALEENRYEALPSPVVVRGFIRIYAKMLGIDSTALIAGLPAEPAPADSQIRPSRTLSTPFSESSLPLRGQHELPVARFAWIALGVLIIAGAFAALKYGKWDDVKNSSLLQRMHISGAASKPDTPAAPIADNVDPAVKPVVVADSESTVPSEVVAPAAAVAASAPASTASTPAAGSNAATVAASVPSSTLTSTPAPISTPTQPPVTPLIAANLANPLQLTLSQDSWIEIRRANKSVVVSRIMKAGTTEAFDVSEPMSLIVGNAAGVDASLRGKPLALTSAAANNVARLDLK
jgi:cytoskeleton protein RodZ